MRTLLGAVLIMLLGAFGVGCSDSDEGSSARFVACANGLTIEDNATGLLWERKTGSYTGSVTCDPGAMVPVDCIDPHDVRNVYQWSGNGGLGPSNGGVFTDFLEKLNTPPGFAEKVDWRIPQIAELQTILVGPEAAPGQDPTCDPSGAAPPCIDPAFAAAGGLCGVGPDCVHPNPTVKGRYWSADTAMAPGVDTGEYAWKANFNTGLVEAGIKTFDGFVRAVRTGSCSS